MISLNQHYHPVLLTRLHKFRSDAARRKFLGTIWCYGGEADRLINHYHFWYTTGNYPDPTKGKVISTKKKK